MSGSSPLTIAYGRGQMPIFLPAGASAQVIRKPGMAKLANPAAAIAAAFAAPVGAPPLAELARGKQSACILICDITRPVPNRLFLRPMIETLVAAGVPLARISILVATGLHRPNLGHELEELVGDPWVMANVSRGQPFCRQRRGPCRSRARRRRAARRSPSTAVSWRPN